MNNLKQELKNELARRYFWEYCKLKAPTFYKEDRTFLKDMCNRLQKFYENDKRILVINLPPRHGKSRTATLLVQWLLGKNNKNRVMTGSYNEILSTTFATQVRDTIQEVDGLYGKIFPNTKIKYGEASKSKWTLEGSEQANYLATSPSGTATGFGCDVMIIDDVIKNVDEAYNQTHLDKITSWFDNTMLSRTEGEFKIIIIMTRWVNGDLAGYILDKYEDVDHINYSAVQKDGTMLCDDILSMEKYLFKTQNTNIDIREANYNQVMMDVKGRLYSELKEYDTTLEYETIECYVDTADEGDDYLSAGIYGVKEGNAYLKDVLYTQEGMEVTEKLLAQMLLDNKVNYCRIESNNGGKTFGRNVERITRELGNTLTKFYFFHQSKNKIARITTNATGVMNNIYFPKGWENRWKEFNKDVLSFQRLGKNKHDDAEDMLTGIYEKLPKKQNNDKISLW